MWSGRGSTRNCRRRYPLSIRFFLREISRGVKTIRQPRIAAILVPVASEPYAGGMLRLPNVVYRSQNRWFPIPRETFNVIIYSFLGLFKIVFLVFNVVPYVALLIVG